MTTNFPKPLDKQVAAISDSLSQTQDGLAIVANGNTHAAVSSGQFVYVKNHDTLAEGLYKATSAIDANGTLSTSNLAPDGSGGLNDLQSQVTALNSNIADWESVTLTPATSVTIWNTSVVKKNTLLKLVSVGMYLPISGSITAGSTLVSGFPTPDGNTNFEAVNYKADTSKFANAVFIDNSGNLNTRENISNGDTIMLTAMYKMA